MNDNSILIDDYTLSVLHFDDPNEPIKDECGKLKPFVKEDTNDE